MLGIHLCKRFYKWPTKINEIKKLYNPISTVSLNQVLNTTSPNLPTEPTKIKGWIKNIRNQKNISFIEVNDGSDLGGIQVVGNKDAFHQLKHGACVEVEGSLVMSQGKTQQVEMQLQSVKQIGECPEDYPLQPKYHTMEFLREIAHFRSRSNTFGAMFRIRNQASMSIHKYFQKSGFVWVHTPTITASDCEGGGEQFQIKHVPSPDLPPPSNLQAGQEHHFFGQPAYLTVSGQLEAEIYALSHSRVYTFGPTFRAERSNTTRHLAEFYMIEPEMAFIQQADNVDIAEDFLKSIMRDVMENCREDLEFFDKKVDPQLLVRLNKALDRPFVRLTYTEALEILTKQQEVVFENPIKWGDDLQREHERFLTKKYDDVPVFVTLWPKSIKPFYMRENQENPLLVDNMDLLVPDIGELIGGSIREERYPQLLNRIKELKMDEETYQWYIELRKFGSAPHGGFGLGFERFLQYLTGMKNIRDVIPIPRHQNYCKF
ncbi:asparagine-tRNA ligase [Tieghemostelium lacteum]|uniref:asparagine--tRNA ligase n=1 Tax=Tieghemostelium lacteum TaxID=361077 RepID=A0A151Z5T3_TIELA|nr:asparagine-tRNA ligase [Tieghemostelium lacteum]|eukprot:KYQ89298.1 asparagine-tRNA ligase [Tieghemostelium lacteum]